MFIIPKLYLRRKRSLYYNLSVPLMKVGQTEQAVVRIPANVRFRMNLEAESKEIVGEQLISRCRRSRISN